MQLKLIKLKKESSNCFNLILEKPVNFSFYPGQYLDIKLPVQDKFGDTRAFTISSSPTEDFLMITPKKGITPFKKFAENLKVGDIIESSHPAGTFTLDETSSAIFLAGGIGITPFRSIIKYVVDQKVKTKITLIYSNSDKNFVFKQELDNWQKINPKLKIIYRNSGKLGRLILNSKFIILNSIYYLAGSHSFVNDIAKMLINSGVDETNIRYDRFDGYD